MTLDTKFAAIAFALAGLVLFWLVVITVIRWAVFHIAARATHSFFVSASGEEPQCATCPFNRKCPYSNGIICHFTPGQRNLKRHAQISIPSHSNPAP